MQHYLLSILVSLAFLSGYVISAFLTSFLKRKVHFVSGAILMGISQAVLGLALKSEVGTFKLKKGKYMLYVNMAESANHLSMIRHI